MKHADDETDTPTTRLSHAPAEVRLARMRELRAVSVFGMTMRLEHEALAERPAGAQRDADAATLAEDLRAFLDVSTLDPTTVERWSKAGADAYVRSVEHLTGEVLRLLARIAERRLRVRVGEPGSAH